MLMPFELQVNISKFGKISKEALVAKGPFFQMPKILFKKKEGPIYVTVGADFSRVGDFHCLSFFKMASIL